MTRTSGRTWIARLAAGTLAVFLAAPASFGVPIEPSLFGTVVTGAAQRPVAGARVWLRDVASGEVLGSLHTGADGRYALAEIEAGRYAVAVEAAGGLFVVQPELELAAGGSRRLNLAIREPERPDAGTSPSRVQGRANLWDNPLTATLLVVGSAVGVGVLVESATDDDDPTTPTDETCASPPCS